MQFFARAIHDAALYPLKAHHEDGEKLARAFQEQIFVMLKDVRSKKILFENIVNQRQNIQNLIDRVYADIETDLRLSIHEQQNVTARNLHTLLSTQNAKVGGGSGGSRFLSSATSGGNADARKLDVEQSAMRTLASAEVFRLPNLVFNTRQHIEERVQKSFYELSAVALHDTVSKWATKMHLCVCD